MVFKVIVVVLLFLEFFHNWWIEDQIKKIAKDYNIELETYSKKKKSTSYKVKNKLK